MSEPLSTLVLGSSSPRRLELLQQIIHPEMIRVCPPLDSDEASFAGLTTQEAIFEQLREISRKKCDDVAGQVSGTPVFGVLTADTVVIAGQEGQRQVLGKPDGPEWPSTVREWFLDLYSDAVHEVATAITFLESGGRIRSDVISTRVRFHPVDSKLLDWYLRTGESLGKAGGYGIQTQGNLFVHSIEGSLSNVIGLPLEWVWDVLFDCGLIAE